MKLRGHHLICLNFFKGEGYSKDFINNIKKILKSDKIEVVHQADEVCAKCPYLSDGICKYKENSDEEIKKLDELAFKLLKIYPNSIIDWHTIKKKLPKMMKEWKKYACKNCDWLKICENNEEWLRY